MSYADPLHETFLLLLDTGTVENIKSSYIVLLEAFHAIGYFSILVLVFNLLMASVVNTYSLVRSNCDVYCGLHGTEMVLRCQDRTPIIARSYAHFMHKAFVVQYDEVYIACLTCVDQCDLTEKVMTPPYRITYFIA